MKTFKLVALSLALVGAGVVQATALPADTVTPSVDTVATFFGGTLLDFALTNVSNIAYNGTARAAVYDTGTGLDFYYQFSNNASSATNLERFSAYNFSSLNSSVLNVFQTASAFGSFLAGTESSNGADRTSWGVVGFSFVPNGRPELNPGTSSFTQIIRTSARSYTAGNFGLLSGVGDNARGFAPAVVTPVPEPEIYTLLLAGIGAVGWVSRRRAREKNSAYG